MTDVRGSALRWAVADLSLRHADVARVELEWACVTATNAVRRTLGYSDANLALDLAELGLAVRRVSLSRAG